MGRSLDRFSEGRHLPLVCGWWFLDDHDADERNKQETSSESEYQSVVEGIGDPVRICEDPRNGPAAPIASV
jgi:hypothetical protein